MKKRIAEMSLTLALLVSVAVGIYGYRTNSKINLLQKQNVLLAETLSITMKAVELHEQKLELIKDFLSDQP